jgi:hypothetical protein
VDGLLPPLTSNVDRPLCGKTKDGFVSIAEHHDSPVSGSGLNPKLKTANPYRFLFVWLISSETLSSNVPGEHLSA